MIYKLLVVIDTEHGVNPELAKAIKRINDNEWTAGRKRADITSKTHITHDFLKKTQWYKKDHPCKIKLSYCNAKYKLNYLTFDKTHKNTNK